LPACFVHRCGLVAVLFLALAVSACDRGQSLQDVPTPASVDALATQTILTQNAPPPGFRNGVSFPQVDQGLNELSGWHYEVLMSFDGVFASTPRKASASTQAEVWFNQLGTARRVVVQTSGDLIATGTDNQYEAVRLGPDTFLVRDATCLKGKDAELAASLSAGTLIGGVKRATPAGVHAVINNEEVWRYAFGADDLVLPNIQLREGGKITLVGGELWVAPKDNAVVRFYLNLDVENVSVFNNQLPVSGKAIVRYDLSDVGVVPNISVPFGC
jgi:hypothetical protein